MYLSLRSARVRFDQIYYPTRVVACCCAGKNVQQKEEKSKVKEATQK
jgi:hypothetical protein